MINTTNITTVSHMTEAEWELYTTAMAEQAEGRYYDQLAAESMDTFSDDDEFERMVVA